MIKSSRKDRNSPVSTLLDSTLDFLEEHMIRSMMLVLAIGAAAAAGCVASDGTTDEDNATLSQNSGGGFQCVNKQNIQVVSCIGSISILPINVDIKNVRVLNDNELNVLSGDLNHVS